jgi:hypothetical protein
VNGDSVRVVALTVLGVVAPIAVLLIPAAVIAAVVAVITCANVAFLEVNSGLASFASSIKINEAVLSGEAAADRLGRVCDIRLREEGFGR